jgi:hypothetical protein
VTVRTMRNLGPQEPVGIAADLVSPPDPRVRPLETNCRAALGRCRKRCERNLWKTSPLLHPCPPKLPAFSCECQRGADDRAAALVSCNGLLGRLSHESERFAHRNGFDVEAWGARARARPNRLPERIRPNLLVDRPASRCPSRRVTRPPSARLRSAYRTANCCGASNRRSASRVMVHALRTPSHVATREATGRMNNQALQPGSTGGTRTAIGRPRPSVFCTRPGSNTPPLKIIAKATSCPSGEPCSRKGFEALGQS